MIDPVTNKLERHRLMVRMAMAALAFSLGAMPLHAQDQNDSGDSEDLSKMASPNNPGRWAAQIQQNYPSKAIMNGEEGTVTMRVTITEEGTVSECEVTGTSGSETLDAAACTGMQEFGRYLPARDQEGKPIQSQTTQAIRYILPERPSDQTLAGGWWLQEGSPGQCLLGRTLTGEQTWVFLYVVSKLDPNMAVVSEIGSKTSRGRDRMALALDGEIIDTRGALARVKNVDNSYVFYAGGQFVNRLANADTMSVMLGDEAVATVDLANNADAIRAAWACSSGVAKDH